jgi:hypothetical protein
MFSGLKIVLSRQAMKKKIIITSVVAAFVILTVQVIHEHITSIQNERYGYVNALGCQFSAKFDTLFNAHNIILTDIQGTFDYTKEQTLNTRLKYNGVLGLFLYRPNGNLVLRMSSVSAFAKGDSIYIDCTTNKVRIYHRKHFIAEEQLSNLLRGRPF